MAADLERISAGVEALQEGEVAAGVPFAAAGTGNTDALPVIAAEMGGAVQIQPLPEGEQSLAGLPVLPAQIQLAQPPLPCRTSKTEPILVVCLQIFMHLRCIYIFALAVYLSFINLPGCQSANADEVKL